MEIIILLTSIFIFFTLSFSYYYSSELVTTPSVTNCTLDQAKDLLEKNNLTAEVSYEIINSSQSNIVISQDPPTNTLLVKNSKVKIVIGISDTVVEIIDPSNNNFVSQNSTVNGTVKKLHPGDRVYLIIQPQPFANDGPYRWYIQPTPNQPIDIPIRNDGSWITNAYFGSRGDEGRKFLIVAIVTNQELTQPLGFNLPDYKSISNEVFVTRA